LRKTGPRLANVMGWSHDDAKRYFKCFVDICNGMGVFFVDKWEELFLNVNVISISYIL